MNRIGVFLGILLIASFCSHIGCQDDNEEYEDYDIMSIAFGHRVSESIGSLQSSVGPSIDKIAEVLEEKCKKKIGNDTAYDAILQDGRLSMEDCSSALVEADEFMNEIRGEIVFNKQCAERASAAVDCLQNAIVVFTPCLESEEIEGSKVLVKMATNVLDYVCRNVDQLTSFVANRGPECFEQQKNELIICMNKTSFSFNSQWLSNTSYLLPWLFTGNDQCSGIDTVQNCVVETVSKCEDTTPANLHLINSMFESARIGTPCARLITTTSNEELSSTTSSSTHEVVHESSTSTNLPPTTTFPDIGGKIVSKANNIRNEIILLATITSFAILNSFLLVV